MPPQEPQKFIRVSRTYPWPREAQSPLTRDVSAALRGSHVRGDSLPKDGVMANHSLRRAYGTAATNAGVDEDTVGKLLNHGGRSVTTSYLRQWPRQIELHNEDHGLPGTQPASGQSAAVQW